VRNWNHRERTIVVKAIRDGARVNVDGFLVLR
jgi:hypothetical protein